MKLLILVASLALSSAGCIVPSLTSLDTRLAAVGIDPVPYKWNVEAQLRVVDERQSLASKSPRRAQQDQQQSPRRKIVWASSVTRSGVTRQPVVGEVTRASSSVRIPIENEYTFSASSVPSDLRTAVARVISTILGSEKDSSDSYQLRLHGVDCSQRKRMGWLDLACDLELGDDGASLLTLSKGKVDDGVLKGSVVSLQKGAAPLRYSLLCDSDAEDDEDTGKTPARAFALVISGEAQQSNNNMKKNNDDKDKDKEGEKKHETTNGHDDEYERRVEVVFRFTKSKDGALSSSSGDDAPATVVSADGTAVYLLRGNTIWSRWVLPLVYGLGFIFVLPYAAAAATKALTPKPTVNIEKDGALAKSEMKTK